MTLIEPDAVTRLHLGHFTRPEGGPLAGQKIVASAFVIRHPDGLVLFDTGIGAGHDEAERLFHPVRVDLREALAGVGLAPEEIRVVANCHLHLDHCGGNPVFAAVPIFAQRVEYQTALDEGEEYTIPSLLEFEGARYELHEGEADILPGIRVIPTPGHVAGHQSLVVETSRGRLVLAGQAFDTASEFGAALFASHLDPADPGGPPQHPDWVRQIEALDPWRVLFAHDLTEWERPGERAVAWHGVP